MRVQSSTVVVWEEPEIARLLCGRAAGPRIPFNGRIGRRLAEKVRHQDERSESLHRNAGGQQPPESDVAQIKSAAQAV